MKTLLVILLTVVTIAGCATEPATPVAKEEKEEMIPFRKDGTLDLVRGEDTYLTLNIEIADTDSTITRGMMQRDGLPDLSGMLFLMDEERIQSFWMSNTTISLDIIFINSAQEVVSIQKYTTPLSPDQVLSEYPALYVLEVMAGFSDTHGILEGDKIQWRRE